MQENSGFTLSHLRITTQKNFREQLPHLQLLLLLLASLLLAVPDNDRYASAIEAPPQTAATISTSLSVSCQDFNRLNTLIRDEKISLQDGRLEVPLLLNRIKQEYYQEGGKTVPRSEWHFPLRGYTVAAVGEGSNHGYEPKGYDYYTGNRHGGHPSLDIFIHDGNQDDLDDRTGEHVAVLAITGGVVVAQETKWHAGSELRGGKYLWLYDPSTDHLLYYAHLREITVALGTRVVPGDTLGYVGRTGWNAHKKRSPTHLHLTCLSTATSALHPENIYPDLLRARTIK